MAKRKDKTTYPADPEPDIEPVSRRGGIKVRWATYATLADAEIMAAWASREADRKSALGYDFGYCSPGSITAVAGGYEVCFP